MWSIQKNHSGHKEPWKPGTGKPVPANELAEPRSARLFDGKPLSASTGHAGRKAVCVLCAAPTEEVIRGTCADKIRAEAVEHKRWEEKGGH